MNQATKPATPLHDVVTRPILFSGPMVRALLDGRKTQSRRIVKSKDSDPSRCITLPMLMQGVYEWRQQDGRWFGIEGYDTLVFCDCPYGEVGQRLWVRETWMPFDDDHQIVDCKYAYAASTTLDGEDIRKEYIRLGRKYQWRPSIHMPRKASRITLEITGIRIERLNAISSADAEDEGVTLFGEDNRIGDETLYQAGFRKLWESINGVGSWKQNPWVWVIEFKVV